MKRNVLIMDSNAEHVERVINLALEVTDNIEIYTADSLADAYRVLMEITIDIFIADIVLDMTQPGDTSGMRLIERMRKIQKYVLTPVIFTTAEKDPTLYAFTELNCLSYLTKPCSANEFKKAFEKALNYRTERDEESAVIYRRGGALYPLKVKNIIYIESSSHIMHVHMCHGKDVYVPYKTCNKFMVEADVDYLVQCSRSVVVNRNWVLGFDLTKNIIILKNNLGILDIGSTYRKKIKKEFMRKTSTVKDIDEFESKMGKNQHQ